MVEVFKEIVMENEGLSLCTQNGLVITTKWLSPDIYKVEMDEMELMGLEHILM